MWAVSETDDRHWEQLGRELARRRGELGYSQRHFASIAGLSQSKASDLERGVARTKMRQTTLSGTQRALGWASGSIEAVLEGGAPNLDASGRPDDPDPPASAGALPVPSDLVEETLAASGSSDWTDEERKDMLRYAEFLRSKRKS